MAVDVVVDGGLRDDLALGPPVGARRQQLVLCEVVLAPVGRDAVRLAGGLGHQYIASVSVSRSKKPSTSMPTATSQFGVAFCSIASLPASWSPVPGMRR